MKRPCIALSVLLATLAICLVASPQGSKACSLGELAVAMQVAHHDCDAGLLACPLTACPRLDDAGELEAEMPSLNAAASDIGAVDPMCDECYGTYEDYSGDYADQVEDEATEQGPVVEVAPNLNPAESDTSAVDTYEAYGREYAEEYREYEQAEAESAADEPIYVDGEYPCDDDSTCTEEDEGDEGDGENGEEEATDECEEACEQGYGEDLFYNENYNPYQAVLENASEASDADLVVDECEEDVTTSCPEVDEVEQSTEAEVPELVNPYDAYGRQVGDEDYDAEEAVSPPDVDPCHSEDDEDGDDEGEGDDHHDAGETDETTVQVCPGSSDDCYGDCYGDCYHYYYGCEEPTAEDACEAPASEATAENYSSGYDAAYDNAVYGPQDVCTPCNDEDAPPAYDEAMLEDESEYDMPPLPGVEDGSLAQDDLPWADQTEEPAPTESADVTESEYGSDYADDYYGSFAHDVEVPADATATETDEEVEDEGDDDEGDEEDGEEHLDDLIPPLYEESHYDCDAPVIEASVVTGGLGVSRLAVACGEMAEMLTEMVSEMTQTVRTAHADIMRAGR